MANHEPAVRLRVLGPTQLQRGGRIEQIPSARQRRILAVLAAGGGQPVAADVLIDAVWGERLPAHPEAALQTQLTRVRYLLGRGTNVVQGAPTGYLLTLERAEVDAWRFEDLIADDRTERVAIADLDEALRLWNGEAFADGDGHPAVQPIATRLDEMRRHATEQLADAHVRSGAPARALAVIGPLLAEDTYRDRARAIEMHALYAAGRAPEALSRYQEHRRRLAEDLGLDPSPQLRQIEHDILNHHHPIVRDAAAAQCRPPPLPVSSFVGRDHEIASIRDLLSRARVVTILGPGGVGKTRLAMHAAHLFTADYPDGVWWCDLVSASVGEVVSVVRSRLGVQERADDNGAQSLTAFLGNRHALLVLDNCEHVLADAAEVVDAVVRGCSAVNVLATSRQPIEVDGEHRFRLRPLGFSNESGGVSPAVELFLDRALAAAPGFHPQGSALTSTLDLCRAVGGLPLAIELAATCITRIDVATLASRVGDHLELLQRARSPADRHRSMDAVIEWSYRLLQTDERALLDRLSVFAGAFTLDDAESLAAPCRGISDVLAEDSSVAGPAGAQIPSRLGAATAHSAVVSGALGGLVDKSMVLFHPAEQRYEMLPAVQAVCRVHLDACRDHERWRTRHAELVGERARRADLCLRTSDEPLFSTSFDDDILELRTARGWLARAGSVSDLIELCASTHWYTMLRTRSEMYRWAEQAISLVRDEMPHVGIGRARACAAHGAAMRGELNQARTLAEAGSIEPPDEHRCSLEVLGQVNLYQGRLDEAMACSRAAAQLHAEACDPIFETSAASVEPAALVYAGERAEAEVLARQLTRTADQLGVPSLQAITRYILAETIVDHDAAAGIYRQSIGLAARVGADFVTGLANTSLAAREIRCGHHHRARQRLRSVIDHWQRAGVQQQQWLAIRLLIEALDLDDQSEPVAVLASANAASESAGPAYGEDAQRLAKATDRASRLLDADALATAQDRGSTLTDDQAAEFARSVA